MSRACLPDSFSNGLEPLDADVDGTRHAIPPLLEDYDNKQATLKWQVSIHVVNERLYAPINRPARNTTSIH